MYIPNMIKLPVAYRSPVYILVYQFVGKRKMCSFHPGGNLSNLRFEILSHLGGNLFEPALEPFVTRVETRFRLV